MSLRELSPLRGTRLGLGLLVVMLAVASELGQLTLPLVGTLDRYLYDSRMRLQPVRPSSRVVIVDIDDRSIAEQGRWPWTRAKLATLTDRIARDGGARAVGFDMVFGEPHPEQDPLMIRALSGQPVALGYYFSGELGAISSGQLPPPLWPSDVLKDRRVGATVWSGYGANAGPLQAAARGAGFFNTVVDRDGVVRSLPLLADHDGQLYESLAVSVLRIYFGGAPPTLHSGDLQTDSLAFGQSGEQARIPISGGMAALVPFQGRGGPSASRFRYVSATDVIEGRIEPRLFRDRIVLVGASAPGLADLRPTPVSERYPGVEVQASLIAGALEGTIRTRPAEGANVTAIAVAERPRVHRVAASRWPRWGRGLKCGAVRLRPAAGHDPVDPP